jgi:hypothetical protein
MSIAQVRNSLIRVVKLFTFEEQKAIEKEFVRPQKTEGNDPLLADSGCFTEQNLECSQNELTRNISSRSNILAPFNSTLSDKSGLMNPDDRQLLDPGVIHWTAKVRDINRQYERNNNCELDNGVYNKLVEKSPAQKGKQLDPFGGEEEDKHLERQVELEDEKEKEEHERTTIDSLGMGWMDPERIAAQIERLNSIVNQPLMIGTMNVYL